MNIKNSHVLVTGGSSGIGKETAKLLVSQGAKVVITGRYQEKLNKVAKEIGAIPLVFDISEMSNVADKAKEALRLLNGKIDALINNAGIGTFGKLGELSLEDFIQVYNTNVFGLALFTQELLPTFKTQNYGNIINIASTASQKGFASGTIYASSKFALRGMTQCWQAELRPNNIRVVQINPSEVTTSFYSEAGLEARVNAPNKLDSGDIAHTIVSTLSLDNKGFVPEVTVWATNPF